MGIITKPPVVPSTKKTGFTIRDTDFLLRIFNASHILGADIAQANITLAKLKAIHEKLSNQIEEVL